MCSWYVQETARIQAQLIDMVQMTHGPSYERPAMSIDDSKRSPSVKNHDRSAWSNEDIAEFKPERWLIREAGGAVSFNPKAGPSHPFGAGPRACEF